MHLSRREVGEAVLAEEGEDPRALVAADAPWMRPHSDRFGRGLGARAAPVPGRPRDAERVARGLHAELAVMGVDERHARLPSPREVASRSSFSIISAIRL